MRRPALLLVLAFLLPWLRAPSLAAEDGDFKVIVSPQNPADAVDREFLRDAFLKKATEWHDGVTVHPIDLSAKSSVHDQFVTRVLRKTPAQLKTYWNQQIFSGKGVPPPEAETPQEVIAFVLAHPGAVGYIPVDVSPGKAKVIGIR
jgi:ABC-type phosphate transport system substrate-binding protein